MKLEIQNIGKIKTANIKIEGITVIVGDNNTGKSTVGKILATLFTILPAIDKRVGRARMEYVFDEDMIQHSYRFRHMEMGDFSKCLETTTMTEDVFLGYMIKAWKESKAWFGDEVSSIKIDDEEMMAIKAATEKAFVRLAECRKISDQQLADMEIGKAFRRYFYGNVKSAGCDAASVRLTVKDGTVITTFREQTSSELPLKITHYGWFLGSPLVVNSISRHPFRMRDQERMHAPLLRRLSESQDVNSVTKAIVRDKIRPIEDRLESVLEGRIYYSEEDDELMIKGDGYRKPLPVKVLSMGLKAFAVLRWMLDRGVLQEKDVLVLDEPENHLHPSWQILYAEIIVMLQQCFNLRILLTTHSPYFLEAIQLFSKKYGISDRFFAYQPEVDGISGMTTIDDEVADNAELYKKFTAPLRELDTMRAEFVMR